MAKTVRQGKGNLTRRVTWTAAQVRTGMMTRVHQRCALTATLRLPAVPALIDHYEGICARVFSGMSREYGEESQRVRAMLERELRRAFAFSQRSQVELSFLAPPGAPMTCEIRAERRSLVDAYDHWLGTDERALFGKCGDARILDAASELGQRTACPVLDFGAGTGRNALALARLGHPVDAVEITSRFAQMIASQAEPEKLPVHVIDGDVLRDRSLLRGDYKLVFASEVASDFRELDDLRRFFELAAAVLVDGGLLVFNAHLTRIEYTPDRAAREFAQQCYSAIYTPAEVARAAAGLPFELASNDSAVGYERSHLPNEAWPPTPWFENWATGRDVFEIDLESSPIELRWLVFRKSFASTAEPSLLAKALGATPLGAIRLDEGVASDSGVRPSKVPSAAALREALLRRMCRRAVAGGQFTFPAIPALRPPLFEATRRVYDALGRTFSVDQLRAADEALGRVLEQAFRACGRSNAIVEFSAPMGTDVKVDVSSDATSLASAYEDWLDAVPGPLFGDFVDARIASLVQSLGEPCHCPVLDLGAGLGRNSLWLAGQGFVVDAVELTPRFAKQLGGDLRRRGYRGRVIGGDIFEVCEGLGQDYGLVILAGVAADFRDPQELGLALGLAAGRLRPGGVLVASVHVTSPGFEPDLALRQWSLHNCAMCFTPQELSEATVALPLDLVSNDSAYDFERTHLPASQWPPTPVFEEWALGRHLIAGTRAQIPIDLRWLVYERRRG